MLCSFHLVFRYLWRANSHCLKRLYIVSKAKYQTRGCFKTANQNARLFAYSLCILRRGTTSIAYRIPIKNIQPHLLSAVLKSTIFSTAKELVSAIRRDPGRNIRFAFHFSRYRSSGIYEFAEAGVDLSFISLGTFVNTRKAIMMTFKA